MNFKFRDILVPLIFCLWSNIQPTGPALSSPDQPVDLKSNANESRGSTDDVALVHERDDSDDHRQMLNLWHALLKKNTSLEQDAAFVCSRVNIGPVNAVLDELFSRSLSVGFHFDTPPHQPPPRELLGKRLSESQYGLLTDLVFVDAFRLRDAFEDYKRKVRFANQAFKRPGGGLSPENQRTSAIQEDLLQSRKTLTDLVGEQAVANLDRQPD